MVKMLHILVLILKVIGIILAVILGILLLVIGIVLFVPIRYEASAKCDGTIESLRAKLKVTWLLHLLRADVLVKGKKLKWQVRAAWFKKTSALSFGKEKEGTANEETKTVEKADSKDEIHTEAAEIITEKLEEPEAGVKESRLEEPAKEAADEAKEQKVEEPSRKSKKTKKTDTDNTDKEKKRSISDKIKDLLQKKDKITDFLTDKSHVRAFQKVKKALFIMLKRWKPKKINAKVHFGFEDPSVTGKVLAGLSIMYPFLGDTTEIIPDFENFSFLKFSIIISSNPVIEILGILVQISFGNSSILSILL